VKKTWRSFQIIYTTVKAKVFLVLTLYLILTKKDIKEFLLGEPPPIDISFSSTPHDEAINIDGLTLAYSMDALSSLLVKGRVPALVGQNDMRSFAQIKTSVSKFGRDKKDPAFINAILFTLNTPDNESLCLRWELSMKLHYGIAFRWKLQFKESSHKMLSQNC
jgi:hypothetical protein